MCALPISGASNALAVPVVNAITPARFYSDLYIGHRPAVIRGLVDHWPARSKWSLDAVAEALGDQPVQLQWDRSRDPSYESNSNRHREIGRASCRERVCQTCRSRWSPDT